MALKPIADENGDITFTGDGDILIGREADELRDDAFCVESTGDPALDRILIRAHMNELQLRELVVRVKRIEQGIGTVRPWHIAVFVLGALAISSLIEAIF